VPLISSAWEGWGWLLGLRTEVQVSPLYFSKVVEGREGGGDIPATCVCWS